MQKQIDLKIYGRVQGVFFRGESRMKARELNLLGFARNEPDGTVRIVAQGEEVYLKALIEWCKNGPEHSKVDKVEIKWEAPAGRFTDFIIM